MATPTINNVAPTPSTLIANNTTVSFDVFLTSGSFARIIVTLKYPGLSLQEVVYDGAAFTTPYIGSSYVVAVSDMVLGNGFHFSLLRQPVWPDSPQLVIYAISDTGNTAAITTYSWLIAAPAQTTPPPNPPQFPVNAGPGEDACNAVMKGANYFLALYDRTFDTSYLAPLKVTPNSGYECYQANAKLFERVSTAIERLECGSFIIFAKGGSFATGTVELYRLDDTHGAVTIKAGSVVTTSEGARDFITLTDAVFGVNDLGPVAVSIRSIAQGWEWNVPGERITAHNETLPGAIDTVKSMIQADPADPAQRTTFIEPNMMVRQVANTTGGAAPMLDGLGADRGMPRRSGESDEAYRLRIRSLPDTVSPGAVERLAHSVFDPLNVTFDFIETFDIRYQTCWDAPSALDVNPNFDTNLFCYDDPRPAYGPGNGHDVPPGLPFYNRWLDELEFRGAFIVVVQPLNAMTDVGMGYDDVATTPAGFQTTIGRRAYTAYDVPQTFSPSFGLQGGYDGFDLQLRSVYSGLWQALQRIKAAGVAAIVERAGE